MTDSRRTTGRHPSPLAAVLLCGMAAGCAGTGRPAADPVARPHQPVELQEPAPIARHDQPRPVPPTGYIELPPAP